MANDLLLEADQTAKVFWKPNPGRQTFALSQAVFELLYGGARGGGKTDAGIAWMLKPVHISKFRGLVIRKNAEDLSDWCDRAERFFATAGGVRSGKPAIFTFPSGAVIRTGHLKDEKAYTKYQGHEYQRILIEELTHIPRYEDYEALRMSCRSTIPELDARVFATTNPGEIGHLWVKEYFIDVAKPMDVYWDSVTGRSRMFIPATVEDNPVLMESDPDYIKSLEGIKDENLRQAWRYGVWDIYEVKGAFYTNELNRAMQGGRIGRVPYDPKLPVHTCWDLGVSDLMVVWFIQIFGKEFRLIGYYQINNTSLLEVINHLKNREFFQWHNNYGRHIAPHDIEVREMTTLKTRKQTAFEAGWVFEVAPKLPIQDGIDNTRNFLDYAWIDQEKCKVGLLHLRNYRRKWNDALQVYSDEAIDDISTHAADALRTGAVVLSPEEIDPQKDLKARIKRLERMKQEQSRSQRRLTRFV